MRSFRWLWIVALLLGACATQPEVQLPTLAVLPSPSTTLTAVPTHPPTQTAAPVIQSQPTTETGTPPPEIDTPLPQVTSFPALVGNINVSNAPGIALRLNPSPSADVIAVLPGGTVVTARGRTDDSQWIEVAADQGSGWVAASDVYALQDLTMLQVLAQGVGAPTTIAAAPTALVGAPTITPSLTITPTLLAAPTSVTLGDIPAMEHRLQTTPILDNLTADRVLWIFQRGRDFGLFPRIFTTIGDSNTTNGDFLQPIGMGVDIYCNFATYAYLQAAVDYFSVAPKSDESNSFVHHSMTARKGFNSSAVLDPFWATDAACYPGESPLVCEYRTIRPSIAIIMLGGIDVANLKLSTADYNANMRAIVQTSIQQGIIPVLTTFVVLPDRGDIYERSLEFNMALLDIARDEQVPLINLWAATQTLPDDGIGPDHTHLKAQVGSYCSFDGAQQQFGGTLRNLLTLQALDQLRQNVLSR